MSLYGHRYSKIHRSHTLGPKLMVSVLVLQDHCDMSALGCDMQSLVERRGHWEGASLELFQRSMIPDATLAFISLFSVALAMPTHLPGCPGASPGYLFATSVFHSQPSSCFFCGTRQRLVTVAFLKVFFLSSLFSFTLLAWSHLFNYSQCHLHSRCFLRFCCFTDTQAGQHRVLARCCGLTQAELSFYSGPAVSW